MPKVIVSGRGGSGKSTVVALLAQALGEQGKVLVVDTDESNLGFIFINCSPLAFFNTRFCSIREG